MRRQAGSAGRPVPASLEAGRSHVLCDCTDQLQEAKRRRGKNWAVHPIQDCIHCMRACCMVRMVQTSQALSRLRWRVKLHRNCGGQLHS